MRLSRFKKVMILDAYSTRTLACVRSFGARGIPFVVGGQTPWDMSFSSRYCKEKFVYTSPYISIERFLGNVRENAEKFGADLIFPTSEAAILACDMQRSDLGGELLAPSSAQINVLFRKWETLRLADSVGMRIPRTHLFSAGDQDALRKSTIDYPAIIKANASSSLQGDRVLQGGTTAYVYSKDDLISEGKKRFMCCQEIVVQEFINGYGVGISGVFKEGKPVALFGHRRLRETNPCGGPSAVAMSIPVSEELSNCTSRLMTQTGYTGAAMVEYKIDRLTAVPYLMEVNCRLWGSILLPLAAGLDLPYLLWKVINGQPIEADELLYEEGVIGRHLLSDTKHLLGVLKGKPTKWPGYFPERWETFRDYVALFFLEKSRNLLATGDDPKPAIGLVIQHLFA